MKKSIKKDNIAYFFIAPFFIVLIIFNIYPIIYSFVLSFMKWDGSQAPETFVGLKNYARLITDKVFYQSIGNTWIMWLGCIIPQMIFALGLAVLLSDKKLKGGNIFRALYYLPNLITMASIGALFSFILDWRSGTLNKILMGMHIIKSPIDWLQSTVYTRSAISFTLWWIWFGYSMIIFMAGIKSIPEDYYDAACVDGASKWQSFRYITLPLLQPTMLYQVVTSVIGGLTIFDIPFVLTSGEGGPKGTTLSMVMYLYNTTFKVNNFGYGATIGVGLFILIGIFVLISFKIVTRKPVYE